MKADFEAKRAAAEDRVKNLRDTLERQAAVNRTLGLGPCRCSELGSCALSMASEFWVPEFGFMP
ncbi:hypothetical protein XI03_10190 [Bradyrhizobium sp. CCBAU 65884]|nr:hypothetical protein [Bradyrhizobium sp. CCBAU 65884]